MRDSRPWRVTHPCPPVREHLCSVLFYRLLQSCSDDSLNVALPMRMLEVFSSENTYLPVLQDASYVASVIEQILHYVIQNGRWWLGQGRAGGVPCRAHAPAPSTRSDGDRAPLPRGAPTLVPHPNPLDARSAL